MSTVQQYEDIQTEVDATKVSADLLTAKIRAVYGFEEQSELLNEVYNNLNFIGQWAQDNIEEIQETQVINDFLASLKSLMEEYSAVFDVVSTASGVGYGENYGETGSSEPVGIKVSVSKDGNTDNKVFETLSLSEDDIS